jgi:hypothetical protein
MIGGVWSQKHSSASLSSIYLGFVRNDARYLTNIIYVFLLPTLLGPAFLVFRPTTVLICALYFFVWFSSVPYLVNGIYGPSLIRTHCQSHPSSSSPHLP